MKYFKVNEEKIKAYIERNTPLWQQTGAVIKKAREQLSISKKALAQAAGICVKTLTKLENGLYIRRFKVVSKSCLNALKMLGYEAKERINRVLTV